MLFHFKDQFPLLSAYWDKYLEFQKRVEVPAKTVLLEEGHLAANYIFVEKGCIRAHFNNKGDDKTVQFFFENEGLISLESFLKNTPSLFTIETIEPSVIYVLPKVHVNNLLDELSREPDFMRVLMKILAERQFHYMNEFVSFIRDTPEERYQNLISTRPHIVQRVPQHYIASYLGIQGPSLSRIRKRMVGR